MANTVDVQILEEGLRNLVIKLTIKGDGTGDENDTVIIDPASFLNADDLKAMKVTPGSVLGFDIKFLYEGSPTSLEFAVFSAGTNEEIDWTPAGGNINGVTGKTGKILLTTVGLSVDDVAVVTLYFKKRRDCAI